MDQSLLSTIDLDDTLRDQLLDQIADLAIAQVTRRRSTPIPIPGQLGSLEVVVV